MPVPEPEINNWSQFPSREKSFLLTLFGNIIPEDSYNNFNKESLRNLYIVTKNLMDANNSTVVIHGSNSNQ